VMLSLAKALRNRKHSVNTEGMSAPSVSDETLVLGLLLKDIREIETLSLVLILTRETLVLLLIWRT